MILRGIIDIMVVVLAGDIMGMDREERSIGRILLVRNHLSQESKNYGFE